LHVPHNSTTGDESADYLLRHVRLLRRIGSPRQKEDAARWETLILTHALPIDEPLAVNFATAKALTDGKSPNAKR
jgi:hypothetical protein